MARGCLNGEILRIDLSAAKVRKEPAYDYTRRFLGGRGVNHWLMLNEMKPGISPFDPDSMIFFGAGALCGTPAPACGRLNISGPNTLTGGIGSASAGGLFAPELRFAGFENIVVTGKALRPSYIWIHDDQVTLCDAGHIWGKNTWETQDAICKELGPGRHSNGCHRAGRREPGQPGLRGGQSGQGRRPLRSRRGHGIKEPEGHRG